MRIVSFLTSPILTVSFLPGATEPGFGAAGLAAGAGEGVEEGGSGDVWGVSSDIIKKGTLDVCHRYPGVSTPRFSFPARTFSCP